MECMVLQPCRTVVDTCNGDGPIHKFNFYEFVGILIPGVLLFVGIGFFLPDNTALQPLLLPDNLGSATVHLMLAYAAGHLVQGLGNAFESGYWKLWKGVPTDWPFRRPSPQFPARNKELIQKASKLEATTIDEWHQAAARARTLITAKGLTSRLDVFNGNYGMFRGVVVVGLIFLGTTWALADEHLAMTYVVITVATGLAVFRMHRFAVHYGLEFFACVGTLETNEATSHTRSQSQDQNDG